MVSKKTVKSAIVGAVALTVAGGAGYASAGMIDGDSAANKNLVRVGMNGCDGKNSCKGSMKDGAESAKDAVKKEKCYGVVKQGSNDCANLSKTHSCAGQATADGDEGEWLYLPAGVCEKLTHGKTHS